VVLQKYPSPATAVKVDVLTVVCQFAAPLPPNPVAVPLLAIVTPEGIVTVSPEVPNVNVVPLCGST